MSALNLVAYPLEHARARTCCARSCAAARDAAAEAGAAVVGGHSIDDPEPKYGMAVTGIVHPRAVLTNAGGRAGDALVLTKPLGAGAVATALKRGLADDDAGRARRRGDDRRSTRRAAAQARAAGAHALTDVTGFGLLGHVHELAQASGVAAADRRRRGARDRRRARAARRRGRAGGRLPPQPRRRRALHDLGAGRRPSRGARLACDAMTSGGLLAAVPRRARRRDRRLASWAGSARRARHDHRHLGLSVESSGSA